MAGNNIEQLHDAGLAFTGKIIAAQTHEVTNALNVINELTGLQLDILQEATNGQAVDVLEIEQICAQIRQHVQRGQKTVKCINWLAHRFDHPIAVFNINELLSQIIDVAEQWAKLSRANFVLDLPGTGISLEIRPFFLIYALFLCIDTVTSGKRGDQTISVEHTIAEENLVITFTNETFELSLSDNKNNAAMLHSLLSELGGRAEVIEGRETIERIVLLIPHQKTNPENEMT